MPQRNGPDVFFSFPGRKGSVSWFLPLPVLLYLLQNRYFLLYDIPEDGRSILNSIKVPIREFTLPRARFRYPLTFSKSITVRDFPKHYYSTHDQAVYVRVYYVDSDTSGCLEIKTE